MSAIYEMYAIKSEELENLRIEYEKILGLLSRLKAGEVHLDQLQIEGNGWSIQQTEDALGKHLDPPLSP